MRETNVIERTIQIFILLFYFHTFFFSFPFFVQFTQSLRKKAKKKKKEKKKQGWGVIDSSGEMAENEHNSIVAYSVQYSNQKLLKIPKQNLKSLRERCFGFMASSVLESLPATLRNVPTLFKSDLKTFLCARALQ